jgi:ABC-type branched-subunit amino acid transport system substrate-binding protein
MAKGHVRSRLVRGCLAALLAVGATVLLTGVPEAGAQQNPPVNQPGVTSSEIHVGGVATITGDPTGSGNKNKAAFDGVQAYFNYLNSTGGIYGRKLVLVSKRDDALANNRTEVQGLISQDNVFAVLPVNVDLFSGADLLAQNHVPTFGWNINAEWGSENNPSPANLFGEDGSFTCFTCTQPGAAVWLPKKLNLKRVGIIAYSVPQSKGACQGTESSIRKFGTAQVAFVDYSVSFGNADYSAQVSQMAKNKVDYVVPCLDGNGVVSLSREMLKQGLHAVQVLPNAYNADYVKANAQFLNGNYVYTIFAPFETRPLPSGLALYMKWLKKSGGTQNENSVYGWLNADLFVAGLRGAGPNFTRQKLVDAINAMKSYTAGGILPPIDWTIAHKQQDTCYAWLKISNGAFKPVFGQPGKPFLCYPPSLTAIPLNPPAG